MFGNVLVGVDGRQGGRDAIALAQALAGDGAAITLAHIVVPVAIRGAIVAIPAELAEAREMLERERERAGVDARLEVRCESSVARALHELAEEEGADLLVVGSTHHTLLGRVGMADDARAALGGAPCALAIAPHGAAHVARSELTYGVGYDGSPESEAALAVARVLAAERGARLEALWVVSLPAVEAERPIPADWPRAAEELVARCAERLAAMDGVRGVSTYGGPREELVRLSRDLDLLIVGSRGYGPLGRLLHGSVSTYLAGHASCPLLVLPRAAVPDVCGKPASTLRADADEPAPVAP